jgi:putative transposase
MTTWLTVGEVAELYELTERTIRSRISDNTFEGHVKESIGGNNRKAYEIDLASLPLQIQQKYYMDGVVKEIKESTSKAPYTLGELKEQHGSAFEKYLGEALKRKKAVLEFIALDNGDKTAGVAEISDRYGFSESALYRYKREYQKHGLIGLFKKPRKDKGKTMLCKEGIKYIRGCYLQPLRPKVSHVHKMYLKEAERQGWKKVSKDTIYREISAIPDSLKCYARDGVKEFNAKFTPQITRTYEDLLANEYWVGDGHTIALWIPEEDKTKRYTFSAWMDMRSKTLVGWCVAPNSNSQVIASALRSGIMRYGLPANCYMDNGKDYKSGYLNADSKEQFIRGYEGIFKALDIGTTFAIPFNAKAKPIERFFETFSSECSRYIPGFCGETIEERPHNLNKKDILVTGVNIYQVVEAIEGYIEMYNNRVHSSLGKKTPMEIMQSVGTVRQDMVAEEELDLLMLRADVKKITASGIKKFGTYYWHDDLIPYFGRSCAVRYDPQNVGELYVYIDGRLTCKAESKELLSMKATEEDVKRWSKKQALARKTAREAIQSYNVTENDVRRAMLEDFVSDEMITSMLTPKNTESVNKGNVINISQNTAKAMEKKAFDKKQLETEQDNCVDIFEKIADDLLAAK